MISAEAREASRRRRTESSFLIFDLAAEEQRGGLKVEVVAVVVRFGSEKKKVCRLSEFYG